jgi:uncharacterized metal-binding protein YceD (DUF177 family)
MSDQPTTREILEAIQDLSTTFDQRFDTVDQRFDTVDRRFDAVDQKFSVVDYNFTEVRRDISQVKQDMGQMKQDLITEIDRFVVLHQTLDVELVSLRSRCERMESFMVQVAKRLDLEYNPT